MPVRSGGSLAAQGLRGRRQSVQPGRFMNNIIYIVGLIVVVLAILSFLGLR